MKPWRAVVDAQTWVSAAISENGIGRKLVDAALRGEFRIVTSVYIRDEILEVMARPRVARRIYPGFEPDVWIEAIAISTADVVGPVEGPLLVDEDPDDDPYLWAAFAGSATHLVTWDEAVLALKHYRGTQIVSPEAFWRVLTRVRRPR